MCVWSHPLACGASDVSTFYSAGAAAVAGKYTKYSTYKNRTDSDVKERTRSLVRLFPHIVVSSPVTVNPIDPPEQPSTNAETTHTHTANNLKWIVQLNYRDSPNETDEKLNACV